MRPRVVRPFARTALVALLLPAAAAAQLVTPRTLPVHQAEQFNLYPSSRPGLGGATIALDDTLADPFTNPAKAARLARGVTLLGAPYSHDISERRGGGRTLPVGAAASGGAWSSVLLGAIQQLDRAGPQLWNQPTSDRTANNQYVTASVARRLGRGLSLGVSAYHAGLGAIDGVDLLYAGSDRIVQNGSVIDLRAGAVQDWGGGHTVELLVVHNRTDMTHDVRFVDFACTRFGPCTRTERNEHNPDRTQIWGVHGEYVRPVGRDGWRLGALATANRLWHPKIPNYTLQNLPRDPGSTDAFNIGLGASRTGGPVTFAFDVVLEPMRSSTWAEAGVPLVTISGVPIPAGGKTVENWFRFKNSRVRTGVGRDFAVGSRRQNAVGVNLGMSIYSIIYDLRQRDNLFASTRTQHEQWMEWTPQLGARYRSRDLEVGYEFRKNCGNQGCADVRDEVFAVSTGAASAGGIIAAPSSPLFLRSGQETSHRFTVAIPVR